MYCDQCGSRLPPAVAACPRCAAPVEPLAAEAVARVPAQRRAPVLESLGSGPGLRAWTGAIVLRNAGGTAAGVFAAWFNVPFTLMMAAVGAVAGGVAGLFQGSFAGGYVAHRVDQLLQWVLPLPMPVSDLLPFTVPQATGIVGALLGAVDGAWTLGWLAFAGPLELMYDANPLYPVSFAIGQVLLAMAVGAGYLLWSVLTEPLQLRLSGARRLSRREAEWLMPLVHTAAERLGLRSVPRVLIDDRREANAYAVIRHIVVQQGLLEQLDHDPEQVGAVLAHELAHWGEGHAISKAWSRGVALPLYLLYELAARLDSAVRSRPLHYLIRFVFWSVNVTVWYLVRPLQAPGWRDAELRADAAAARAGYGEGLYRALTYLRHTFDGRRSGWDAVMLATHPPIELRLEALEQPGRRYPLSGAQPLARAVPDWAPVSTVERDA